MARSQNIDNALKDFAQRIRVALAAANVKPSDLATATGTTPQAVHKWTTGKCAPRSSHLVAICKLTGASLDWIMEPGPVDIRSAPIHEAAKRKATKADGDIPGDGIPCVCGALTEQWCRTHRNMCPAREAA